MSIYFEIAYSLASKRLCLFTGTGFSKAITNENAPSWPKLLQNCCSYLDNGDILKEELFPSQGTRSLSLEEIAQIIDIELRKTSRNIHDVISWEIGKLKPEGDNGVISSLINNRSIRVVTTNYDKLLESFISDPKRIISISPGTLIPRSLSDIKVYHIHGSVDSPKHMVVTADDYFNFLNSPSYFSKKLSTILHENTVVILGYSLGDTNLKAILSAYRGFSKSLVVGSNIIFVSKDQISQSVKDYYSNSYGIRVIDQTRIHTFFEQLNSHIDLAQNCLESSKENLLKVLNDGHSFTDDFLRVENSFFEIISSLGAIGKSLNDPAVVKMLGDIIERKRYFSTFTGAWEQYTQLATWLVYLGSIIEVDGTAIEADYLKAVIHSMKNMSKNYILGKSWQAFAIWKNNWRDLTVSNRSKIRQTVQTDLFWVSDATDLVTK